MLYIVIILSVSEVLAADGQSVDELFRQARRLGFEGHRQEARDISHQILERTPDYHEVRIFLGRLYAWDKEYAGARKELLYVRDAQPRNLEAINAIIDVELWSHNPEKAIMYCDQGLDFHPGNADLLYKKARALADMRLLPEAFDSARAAVTASPESRQASGFLQKLEIQAMRHKMSADLSYEIFNDSRAPWTDLSLSESGKYRWGSLYGRVNLAKRFGRSAEQYELDVYLKLGRGMYLYTNAGYAPSGIFPKWRLGAELYRSLPGSFEVSAGLRYMDFVSSRITLYTGSIGRYIGDYFIWLRPFISNKPAGISFSSTLFIRRYFSGPENYITLGVGGGSTPDEDIYTKELDRLDSRKVSLNAQKLIGRRWVIKGDVGWRTQEYRTDRNRDSWIFGTGLERFF